MKKKNVTNLLDKICKALDILESGDLLKIKQSIYLFQDVSNNIIRQGKKYIQYEDHELDFTFEDVRKLSDEMFNIINRCQKMPFNQLEKRLRQKLPIEIEDFDKMCFAINDTMFFDKFLRPIANDLSFWAITIYLWSESEYKKDFMEQLTDHLRSFL